MKKEQIMLLSAPNNGSDWLVETILESQENLSYYREFFNPITNEEYMDDLKSSFGCENEFFSKIATLNENMCEKTYCNTWQKETYNFTKENYSAYKVSFFAQKFKCFALIRDVKNSFPPSRDEVYNWYNAIYKSMIGANHKKLIDFMNSNFSFDEKMALAYVAYQNVLIEECQKNNIPILKWENLMLDYSTTLNELKKVSFLDTENWAKTLISKRKFTEKIFEHDELIKKFQMSLI